jgi:PAS domain S-box-containing protein
LLESLGRSEARYRNLFELESDAIFLIDNLNGQILEANHAASLLYGYSREELLGKKTTDLSAEPEETKRVTLGTSPGEDVIVTVPLRWHCKKDGSRFPVEITMRFFTLDNRPLLISANRDITERHQAEQHLLELNNNLHKMVAEAVNKNMEQERMLVQQSRLAAMGEMIGNIAHQWRQPINALTLMLANIQDAYEFNELDREYLVRTVHKGQSIIQRMSATIDDFRNFFKPDKEKQRFDIGDATEEAIKLIAQSFVNNEIEILLDKDNKPCSAFGYPNEFSQVVLNLLTNSKDAIVAKKIAGKVRIKIGREGNTATISIQDNGGGIPEENLDKVFDPYFTTKESGTGIGLYMSKMIMRNMDGDMTISNIEDGALVRITLPLAP